MAMPAGRRRAQSGFTLVELLVATVIMGTALVLIVGSFSAGLLDAAVAKRNTATQAVIAYEVEQISGSSYKSAPANYSDCFATENPTAPDTRPNYQDPCASGRFTLRADVTVANGPTGTSQWWTVGVVTWPDLTPVGKPVELIKVNR